jgi:hypothetical protein
LRTVKVSLMPPPARAMQTPSIGLDALALAFLDLHIDAQGVAGLEFRDLARTPRRRGLFLLELLHDC